MGGGKNTEKAKQEGSSNDTIIPDCCLAEELANNEEIVVCWHPNSHCRIRHIGGNLFEMKESKNALITAGDTFRCDILANGHPLQAHHVCHNSEPSHLYVAGITHGITFKRLNDERQT